jgi:hypothetical protein
MGHVAIQIIIAEAILIVLGLALGRPPRWGWAIIIAVVALAVSATGDAQAMVILGLIALVCFGRGIHLLTRRQILRGIILVLLALPLGGTGPAFQGWPPMSGLYERQFRDLVAYQIHLGKQRADPQGKPRYVRPGRNEHGMVRLLGVQVPLLVWEDRRPGFGVDYAQPNSSDAFEAWLVPHRLPPFPYNHLVSLPSFYADETGAIRKVDVCTPGERCPPDAPIVYTVTEAHLEDIAVRIRSASGGR